MPCPPDWKTGDRTPDIATGARHDATPSTPIAHRFPTDHTDDNADPDNGKWTSP